MSALIQLLRSSSALTGSSGRHVAVMSVREAVATQGDELTQSLATSSVQAEALDLHAVEGAERWAHGRFYVLANDRRPLSTHPPSRSRGVIEDHRLGSPCIWTLVVLLHVLASRYADRAREETLFHST